MSDYGRLSFVEERPGRKWLCRCECGVEKEILAANIRSGAVVSCGCWRAERITAMNTKHGMSKSRAHKIWTGMIDRCLNQNAPAYPDYGGRDITVCEQWLSFKGFYADMGAPPNGLTLERSENDQGYNPRNCCWATRKDQGRNKRNNRVLTLNHVSMPQSAWAEILGLRPGTIDARLKRGWSVRRALTTPVEA